MREVWVATRRDNSELFALPMSDYGKPRFTAFLRYARMWDSVEDARISIRCTFNKEFWPMLDLYPVSIIVDSVRYAIPPEDMDEEGD